MRNFPHFYPSNWGTWASNPSRPPPTSTTRRHLPKIVGACDHRILDAGTIRHPTVEALLGVSVSAQILEEAYAVNVVESGYRSMLSKLTLSQVDRLPRALACSDLTRNAEGHPSGP
jgi:hypothetical protein